MAVGERTESQLPDQDVQIREAGWECAGLIADLLDGRDRAMAFRLIEAQRNLLISKDGDITDGTL